MTKIAEVGNTVTFKNGGVVGVVEKVNEKSVMVKIVQNNSDDVFMGNRTIVNHKNYTIVKPI